MQKIYKYFILGFATIILIPSVVLGNKQDGIGGGTGGGGIGGGTGGSSGNVIELKNPFRYDGDLFAFFKTLINDVILPLGGMIAVLAFIYSGFLYVMAQGDQTKIKTAHNALLYTAIGTAILLGSWAIANAIGATIGQLQTG